MFGADYFHGTTRRYNVVFGNLFNEILIDRVNDANTVVQKLRVPLGYGSKDKILARVIQDPKLDKPNSLSLPRMSFEWGAPEYDGDRKLTSVGRIVRKNATNANKFKYVYNPVPYNIPYTLNIYVNQEEDAERILEKIYPNFTPEWSATVYIVPELNIADDIAIVLKSLVKNDQTTGTFENRAILTYTLNFVLKGYFYGPIKNKPIIKFANTHFYVGNREDNTEIVSTVVATPGMLANGEPTSNGALSVSPLEIEVDDNWDYVITQSGMTIIAED